MDNENKTMASEIIAEQKNRLKVVINELESTIDDFLEKVQFVLAQLIELTEENPKNVEEACEFANYQNEMNMFAHIAHDYVCRAQYGIEEIVTREYRNRKGTLSIEEKL